MKSKLKNTAWLIGLLIFNFPVGFAFQMTHNNRAFCSERELVFITGGIAMIIVLGGISLIVRRILKKRAYENYNKTALIVYTVLTGLFFLISMWGFEQAMFDKCGFWLD